MKTQVRRRNPEYGYTWVESDGTYYVRNDDGDVRTVSDGAMRLLEDLSTGEVTKADLDGGALTLVEQLEDGGYLGTDRPVVELVQPADVRLWPRSALFVALLCVGAAVGLRNVSVLPRLFDLLSPTQFATLAGLVLTGLTVHEAGHYLASRKFLDPSFRLSTVNGVIPTVATNTDGAWMLPRNRRRWISLAGPFAELLWILGVAGVGTLVDETSVVLDAYLAIGIVGFSFTLNPLIHGDGYWLLVDTFGVVNLRTRGLEHVREFRPSWAAAYVVVSYLYGALVFVFTLLGGLYMFGPVGVVPVLGLLAAATLDWGRLQHAVRTIGA